MDATWSLSGHPKSLHYYYLGLIPTHIQRHWLVSVLKPFGQVLKVRLPKQTDGQQNKGYGYTEIELIDGSSSAELVEGLANLQTPIYACPISNPKMLGGFHTSLKRRSVQIDGIRPGTDLITIWRSFLPLGNIEVMVCDSQIESPKQIKRLLVVFEKKVSLRSLQRLDQSSKRPKWFQPKSLKFFQEDQGEPFSQKYDLHIMLVWPNKQDSQIALKSEQFKFQSPSTTLLHHQERESDWMTSFNKHPNWDISTTIGHKKPAWSSEKQQINFEEPKRFQKDLYSQKNITPEERFNKRNFSNNCQHIQPSLCIQKFNYSTGRILVDSSFSSTVQKTDSSSIALAQQGELIVSPSLPTNEEISSKQMILGREDDERNNIATDSKQIPGSLSLPATLPKTHTESNLRINIGLKRMNPIRHLNFSKKLQEGSRPLSNDGSSQQGQNLQA